METAIVNTLKENLLGLTLESLKDEDVIINYPYLSDFLNTINNDFPELMIVLDEKSLYTMILSKYIEVYQEFISNKSLNTYDDPALNEIFKNSLFQELKVSYYNEVISIIEKDYVELYSEFQNNSKNVNKAIYASLAAQVYKELKGNDIYNQLYISPYADGYNDEEYQLIREVLSSLINKMIDDDEIKR